MALNESIECIATLIDSNFIYRAFYYKREKEIQLTVCAKEVSSREEKSVDIFGFFASENEDRKKARRLCCVPGSGRTTEYCSELVTLRKTKKSMASGKTAKVLVLLFSMVLVQSTPQHSNLVTITAEGKLNS